MSDKMHLRLVRPNEKEFLQEAEFKGLRDVTSRLKKNNLF